MSSNKRSLEQISKKARKPTPTSKSAKSKKKSEEVAKISLRPRKAKNYSMSHYGEDDDENDPERFDDEDDDDFFEEKSTRKKKVKRESNSTAPRRMVTKDEDLEDIYEDEATAAEYTEEALNKIPKNRKQLEKLSDTVDERLKFYKKQFIQEQHDMEKKRSAVSENCIPICADVRTFDFKKLAEAQIKIGGRPFDVIMMDPPWQLSSSQPSRGVAIAYSSLSDEFIQKIPVPKLQTNGFIFIWTINAKYAITVKLMEHWGYKLVDEITWIKKTVNGKIAKGHGFYLQHAKESCLIGVKGNINERFQKNICSDIIFSQRRGQSQKPEEIYQLIEKLAPQGFYLEIFGRRNNLRSGWVTVGNEL